MNSFIAKTSSNVLSSKWLRKWGFSDISDKKIPGDTTNMSVFQDMKGAVFCDSFQWSLTYYSSFWINLEQVHMFISSSLPYILLVTFGGGKGMVFPEMVVVKKEKDCGLLMWSQVLWNLMEPVFTLRVLIERRPSRFCHTGFSKVKKYYHTHIYVALYKMFRNDIMWVLYICDNCLNKVKMSQKNGKT